MAQEELNAALLGFGTVGTGVYKIIQRQRPEMMQKLNTHLNIRRILVRNIAKYQDKIEDPSILTTEYETILEDAQIDLVIELIGGIEPAYTYIRSALEAGKSVVTANKDLIADRGGELLQIAEENHVELRFEAAVAGGIPIISPLKNSLAANEIRKIMGIVNGTTNYILSKMTDEGMDYGDALAEATRLGYAEADPTADVEGYDAGRKIAILATIAFHSRVTFRDVYTEGITRITAKDISYARNLGRVIKLIAKVEDKPGVLATIASIFGNNSVSIEQVIQKNKIDNNAELVIITSSVKERHITDALLILESSSVVRQDRHMIRVY